MPVFIGIEAYLIGKKAFKTAFLGIFCYFKLDYLRPPQSQRRQRLKTPP